MAMRLRFSATRNHAVCGISASVFVRFDLTDAVFTGAASGRDGDPNRLRLFRDEPERGHREQGIRPKTGPSVTVAR